MGEIEKEYLIEVCKIGQGVLCCRYVIADPEEGMVCGKERPAIKASLDARVNKLSSKGDNCEGWDTCQQNLET